MTELIERFAKVPTEFFPDSTWTIVECVHTVHGNYTLYFSVEDFQQYFMPTIRSLWVNDYMFFIRPAI